MNLSKSDFQLIRVGTPLKYLFQLFYSKSLGIFGRNML